MRRFLRSFIFKVLVQRKYTASLVSDEKDIQAVLMGVNGATALRSILSTLDTKKQALVMGHAVPMPVVIKPREYGQAFYRALGTVVEARGVKKVIDEIF